MGPREWLSLVTISALWGAAFLFTRVATPAFGPILLVALRILIAGAVLAAAGWMGRQLAAPAGAWRPLAVMGTINSALPFLLFAEALRHAPASLAALLNATTPLFSAATAAVWLREPLTAGRVGGMGLGILGVTLLVTRGPLGALPAVLPSAAECLVAAALYGIAAVYAKRRLEGISPFASATYSLLLAGLLLLPLVPVALPQHRPPLHAVGTMLALAVLSTALPYALYFPLIARAGAVQATTVAYLVPAFGVLWGVLLLGETVTPAMLVGFALILCGAILVNRPGAAGRAAGRAARSAAATPQG